MEQQFTIARDLAIGVPREQHEFATWLGAAARWSHFVTFTHRPVEERPEQVFVYVRGTASWAREVRYGREARSPQRGIEESRRSVRRWFHEAVRLRYEPAAAMWAETELHKSGAPHHHALLAVNERVPVKSIRQAWFDEQGYMVIEAIRDPVAVAGYCGKYAMKSAAWPPMVWGLRREAPPCAKKIHAPGIEPAAAAGAAPMGRVWVEAKRGGVVPRGSATLSASGRGPRGTMWRV